MSSDNSRSEWSAKLVENDPRSVAELLAAAVDWNDDESSEEENEAWRAVWVLHLRGTREVLEGALTLCRSPEPRIRARGVDILAQLGCPGRTFPDECQLEMIRLLQQDDHPLVLESAAVALGHQLANRRDSRAIPALLAHKNHSDMNVRHGVAFGLGGYNEPDAVAALIELTEDPEDLVRDWATFGLGALCSADNPAIRNALLRRLADRDEDVRFEALSGLAERKDLKVIGPLVAEMRAHPESKELVDIAKLLVGKEQISAEATMDEVIDALEKLNK
jgi:HEAT repeat protein